jgi:hypothetical protein
MSGGAHKLQGPIVDTLLEMLHGVRVKKGPVTAFLTSLDFRSDFKKGGIFELARTIGVYLHQGAFTAPESHVLYAFLRATREIKDRESPVSHFERLSEEPSSGVIAASMSAIYCYWCIKQQLLHCAAAVIRWQGDDIRGRLLRVLGGLPGADEKDTKKQLQDFFFYAARELSNPGEQAMKNAAVDEQAMKNAAADEQEMKNAAADEQEMQNAAAILESLGKRKCSPAPSAPSSRPRSLIVGDYARFDTVFGKSIADRAAAARLAAMAKRHGSPSKS